jgi:hypothetical protein
VWLDQRAKLVAVYLKQIHAQTASFCHLPPSYR